MQRVTLTNALKVVFALYAVYAAIVAVVSVRALAGQSTISWPWRGAALAWFWVGFALCLLPVAWGLVREKKWAWNAGAGLMIFGLIVGTLSAAATAWAVQRSMTGWESFMVAHLRSFALASARTLLLLALLILARRSYQTAFGAVPTGGELKRSSYVRPVALGGLFLMIAGLMLLHPLSGQYSPPSWRLTSLVVTGILAAGAPLCFLERKAKVARRLAIFAIVIALVGLAVSMTLYTFFAIEGLGVSGLQLVLSILAVLMARKVQASFVD